nr:hypothetical protein [Burkholderia sp. Bp9140]
MASQVLLFSLPAVVMMVSQGWSDQQSGNDGEDGDQREVRKGRRAQPVAGRDALQYQMTDDGKHDTGDDAEHPVGILRE